jgi:hypothetical protein
MYLRLEGVVKSNQSPEDYRHTIRLLKVLSKRTKCGCPYSKQNETYCVELGDKIFSFSSELVMDAKKQNLLAVTNKVLKTTEAGTCFLKQSLNPDVLLATSQNKLKTTHVVINNERHKVQVNTNESPLMRLFSRKTKAGTTYISMEEFQAGERLRKDFERGQLQPKISASLQGSVGTAARSGFSNANDIADFAIDARKRVGMAIDKLGPELSGVTIDICCFLKGLEHVERERRWPPRSAKLMLKTALSLLARHYGIAGYENQSSRKNHSWGCADYRPELNAQS